MSNKLLKGVKAKTYWSTIYFVEPIAIPLSLGLSNFKWLHPNIITFSSLFFMIMSVCYFSFGSLIIGSLFYYLSLILDKTDGKVARMKDCISVFGSHLDIVIDKINKLFPLLGIIYGYYYKNHQFLLGILIIFGLHYGIHFVYHYLLKIKLSAANETLMEIPEAKRPLLFSRGRIYNIFSPQDESFFILVFGPVSGLVTETIITVSLIYLIVAPIMYWQMKKK